VSQETSTVGAPPVRLFTRQATGLRREVSPRSSLIFNTFTAPTPFILAVAVFWILGVFPGANLYIALAGGYAAGMVICFAISTVTTAIPRTGGDYVFVGRILHPLVGIVSSFLYSAATLLSGAAIAYWAVTVALAPSLQVIGLISHGKTLLNWGTTLSTSHGWQFGIAAAFMLAAAVLAGVGWKWALRVQAVGFLLGTLGLIVAALVVLLDGGSTFVSSFNHFAAPITHQSDTYPVSYTHLPPVTASTQCGRAERARRHACCARTASERAPRVDRRRSRIVQPVNPARAVYCRDKAICSRRSSDSFVPASIPELR